VSTVTETCLCGAKLEFSSSDNVATEYAAIHFRRDHAICREKAAAREKQAASKQDGEDESVGRRG